jgi:hypothetical protein
MGVGEVSTELTFARAGEEPDFERKIHYSTYVSIVGVGCCIFLLISFAVLPVEYTYRHYLSVCLVIAIMLMETSFVIPLGNPTNQCFDKITPHDMYSSVNCALSGAFLLGGGWCTVMWGTFKRRKRTSPPGWIFFISCYPVADERR